MYPYNFIISELMKMNFLYKPAQIITIESVYFICDNMYVHTSNEMNFLTLNIIFQLL